MGLRFSECSANSQHVKDCCHLEGETPIEIRIAFSQQRPAAYPSHESHQGTAPRALRFPTHAASAARVPGKPNRARTSSKPCVDDLDEFDAESFTVRLSARPKLKICFHRLQLLILELVREAQTLGLAG
eukprot:g15598.t1